ncbi:MAG TPA: haloalkane dehalogenase [Steroidobacteraceae bacterium]|nr:haloalkane dehalogenase [Steroidobacteraceae bacterium]
MREAGPLRTEEARFAGLPDFPYVARYVQVSHARLGALRMAAVDEGARSAPVALLLHGEPTWSFLYRKMIARLSAAGFRAVAPDFPGFGRSDKPPLREDYSYEGFVLWLREFIAALDLRRITLVCQDWGGPIGLRVLSESPERFAAVLAANTVLPNCEAPPRGVPEWPGKLISDWVGTAAAATDLPVSGIIAAVSRQRLPAEVLRGYDAPFPDASYKSGVLAFPGLIPLNEAMAGIAENRRVWAVLERFERPFLTAFSDSDPTTAPWAEVFQRRVPGARGQPHALIRGAGHFLQEEQGEALATVLLELLARVSRSQCRTG